MQFDPQELFTDMKKEARMTERDIKQALFMFGLYTKYPSAQQRAKALIDMHGGDWKTAFSHLSTVRRSLSATLERDCLCIALEAKEQQAITKGE